MCAVPQYVHSISFASGNSFINNYLRASSTMDILYIDFFNFYCALKVYNSRLKMSDTKYLKA